MRNSIRGLYLIITIHGRIYKNVENMFLRCDNIPILWKKVFLKIANDRERVSGRFIRDCRERHFFHIEMETVKDILNFCSDSIFYDYNNIGIVEELNQVRKCIINNFHKTTPESRIKLSLTLIDDKFLKINDNDFQNVIEIIHDLREKILYMLAFEKLLM